MEKQLHAAREQLVANFAAARAKNATREREQADRHHRRLAERSFDWLRASLFIFPIFDVSVKALLYINVLLSDSRRKNAF